MTPDPGAPTNLPNYGATFAESDYAPIPRRDLPFGVPAFIGNDAWVRATRRPRQRQPARRVHHRVARPEARPRREPATLMPTRYVLTGRIVTVDPAWTVHASGALYIADDRIVRVQDAAAAPPADFGGAPRIATKGTIYPGLIELHNHLSYNALPLWPPLKVYENRGQWAGIEPYRKSVSGPMTVLGKTLGLPQAVVRYVECKCLVAGVTTSQGVALYSNNGIQKFYRGNIRNVEDTREVDLDDALTKIADVEATKARRLPDPPQEERTS